MFFWITFYLALAIGVAGLAYRIGCWFRREIGPEAAAGSVGERVAATTRGVLAAVFSLKAFVLLKTAVLDVLLQRRIGRESVLRWFIHMNIFGGFMLLLLMHALDDVITARLFSDYAATLNPFLFLRNLFGAMVILGVILAAWRRARARTMRLTTNATDVLAIVILAVIMVSGVALEAAKIVSYARFDEMVEEYAYLDPDTELPALKAYWAKEFAVVFPDRPGPADATMLAEGKDLHDISCAQCHSKPQWAFLSYGVAKAAKPIAAGLTRAGAAQILYYVHFLACFLALAYLPFSRFLHMVTSPLCLLVNGVRGSDRPTAVDPAIEQPAAANRATRQMLELDACTHCGTCSLRCSVEVVFRAIPNLNILPSEKLAAIRSLAAGRPLDERQLAAIGEGDSICTRCYRCTSVCPVGIDLQELWFSLHDGLNGRGCPDLFVRVRDRVVAAHVEFLKDYDTVLVLGGNGAQAGSGSSFDPGRFSACFECQTCTNVCPVVACYDDPGQVLGLLPHQIMHSLGLGLGREAQGAAMVWDCLTCYQCQEQCPQGVPVTDLLYELKNAAYTRYREPESESDASGLQPVAADVPQVEGDAQEAAGPA